MQHEIEIIIAGNDELIRDGFKALLKKQKGIKLLTEATDGKELYFLVEKYKPHIVIIDSGLPVLDGIEVIRLIKQNFPNTRIIGFSVLDEVTQIVDMIDAGADGYLTKSASKQEIIEAVLSVSRGKIYYCNTTSKKLLNLVHPKLTNTRTEKPSFTNRELQVIEGIAKGFTNKKIGEALGISTRTVENYRETIQHKIGVKNAAGIVLYAIKNGICNTVD